MNHAAIVSARSFWVRLLADNPEVVLQKKDKAEILRACIERLSAEHREVIDLVYYHDKSIEQELTVLLIGAGVAAGAALRA